MPQILCPLCHDILSAEGRTWRCALGHCFDVAKEGYVNLLLVQNKKSRDPGDTPESVKARSAFLQAGHYQPLRDAVVDLLRPLQAADLLDIGCGEGYYTSALRSVVPAVIGLDIAKAAIQLAARRFKDITWLVGSGIALPVPDASVDVVSSLFSPLPVAEMARVLKPQGHVLVVTPAPEHLWAVREGLFGEVRAHEPDKFLKDFAEGFELIARELVRYPLTLSQQALKDLLAMTPYAWKAKADRRAALEQQDGFVTEAAFSVMLFRKTIAETNGAEAELAPVPDSLGD